MDPVTIPRALLDEALMALNAIPNFEYRGSRYETSYQLAAALSRLLREQDRLGGVKT